MSIIEKYNRIKDEIEAAAEKDGRNPDDIKIISVSKTFPAETVQSAIDSGIELFGENKIQEASDKIPLLHGKFKFHMIGHLQSNKSKEAVRLFDLIHSIDKSETAKKVSIEAEKVHKIQNILIQVNTAGESQKSGSDPENLFTIFDIILPLKNIKIIGLMAMAPFTDDKIIIGNCFSKARKLLEQINDRYNIKLKELSMGMSSDYKIAIAEGATMVRIGSAIFGYRNYK
jgi:hypothetical protein